MKKIIALSALSLLMTSTMANANGGIVNFTGEITNAACDIATDDLSVDLGSIANSPLQAGGTSTPVALDIELQGCVSADASDVQVAFTGTPVAGTTDELEMAVPNGAAIQITKAGDTTPIAVDGSVPVSMGAMVDGANTLGFSAYVKQATSAVAVTAGAFTSTATFEITYQ